VPLIAAIAERLFAAFLLLKERHSSSK